MLEGEEAPEESAEMDWMQRVTREDFSQRGESERARERLIMAKSPRLRGKHMIKLTQRENKDRVKVQPKYKRVYIRSSDENDGGLQSGSGSEREYVRQNGACRC